MRILNFAFRHTRIFRIWGETVLTALTIREDMNLSNLVHENRYHLERYPQQHHNPHYSVTQTETHQPYRRDMATALISNSYTNQVSESRPYQASPNTPPSPPVEDPNNKCTLPSIRSLIGMANDSAASNAAPKGELHAWYYSPGMAKFSKVT